MIFFFILYSILLFSSKFIQNGSIICSTKAENRRAKLKNGENHNDYKAKQAAYMKQYRIEKKQSIENLPKEEKAKMKEDIQKNETMRKRAYRLKKSVSLSPAKTGLRYSSIQGLSRATNRVKKVLPCSPRKKREVVKLLFKQLNIDKEDCLHRKTSTERISQDTVNVIKTFYQRDDISRMAPGKGNVVSIRSDTGKEKVQKRHLYMSIKETYTLFKEETQPPR